MVNTEKSNRDTFQLCSFDKSNTEVLILTFCLCKLQLLLPLQIKIYYQLTIENCSIEIVQFRRLAEMLSLWNWFHGMNVSTANESTWKVRFCLWIFTTIKYLSISEDPSFWCWKIFTIYLHQNLENSLHRLIVSYGTNWFNQSDLPFSPRRFPIHKFCTGPNFLQALHFSSVWSHLQTRDVVVSATAKTLIIPYSESFIVDAILRFGMCSNAQYIVALNSIIEDEKIYHYYHLVVSCDINELHTTYFKLHNSLI